MYIEKRSIAVAIILAFVTCGIYVLYWQYKLYESLYRANNLPSTAGVDLLLSIVTCGIYAIYMMYKMGKLESQAFATHDLGEKDEALLYVILSVFGLAIVSMAIIQSNINTLADNVNNSHYDNQGPLQ
ncbi:MAG: DUF4234 domain-containing protein [Turicibacter sp.]|nr:DUF4234 domain-containing protein [Turicibacter sp.]